MTLEEAIEHCKSVANEKCDSCGAEHRQLAKWLEELRLYRKECDKNHEAKACKYFELW